MAVQGGVGKVSGILLDLSGTLFIENTPTPGALAALDRLRKSGLPLRFISNTSKESRTCLLYRLQHLGFPVKKEELFTSLMSARQVMEQGRLRPMLLLDPAALEDFQGMKTEDPNCVMVGLAPSCFTYEHLTKAFRLLLDGARLLGIKTRYYRRSDGLALGSGPFLTALEYASGKDAELVGKPDRKFYQYVQSELNCPLAETVMIGDDVVNDIHGAQVLGMKGILVKTGKYQERDEESINPPPHSLTDNFSDAVELILKDNRD